MDEVWKLVIIAIILALLSIAALAYAERHS